MIRSSLLLIGAALASACPCAAQSFNIDLGIDNPAPSQGFGAAAGQPGVWNVWSPVSGGITLVDLNGVPTSVQASAPTINSWEFSWDHLGTTGDDELLLDDGDFPDPGTTYTISGLAAGTYTVTTYAWAPDDPTLITGVRVNNGPITAVGGNWTGTYQLGVTHAVHTVTISAGQTIAITVSIIVEFCTVDGIQITQNGAATTSFCSGDGSGTACPCANPGASGNGCASSVSPTGARLASSGSASMSNDSFALVGTLMPQSFALYFQGTQRLAGGAGLHFGDGLRCVGGSIIRLGTKLNSGGTSTYPAAGDPPISVRGANSAGAVRDYQVWYRNAATFCTTATFNLTNGLEATWAP
jgi:hypothetical protein